MISKKAQVTLFVIIGLVILLGISLVFFLTRVVSIDEPNFDPNDVSIETRPAQLLVTSCLESSMNEGLQLLGSQGGYITPPTVKYPSYTSKSVLYEPYAVAYWRYLDDCGQENGCEFSEQPPLCSTETKLCGGLPTGKGSIEEQLENYIEKDLSSCIDEFSSIADQYSIEDKAEQISVDVLFSEGQTQAILYYPITLKSLSSTDTKTIEQYETDVAINMLEIYRLANEIIDFTRETDYYERQTMQVLNVYADVDGTIPPTDHIQFIGNGGGPWVLQQVQQEIRQDILPHMTLIRYGNTNNGVPITTYNDGVYDQYVNGFYSTFLPITSDKEYNFNVYHHYLYEQPFVNVGDGSQLIEGADIAEIKNNPLLKAISNLAMKDYRFEFDISYPLLLSIEDPESLDGQGYTFDFAIEVNVRNNVPAYQNFTTLQSFETSIKGLGDFKIPTTHTITSIDKHTGESLDNVKISYVCGNEYDIGFTEIVGETAQLRAELPVCQLGGFIRYQKDGYLGEAIPFNNVDDIQPQTFNVALWPIQQREIIVRKRSLEDIQNIVDATTQGAFAMDTEYSPVTDNDSVLVTVERNTQTAYDTPVPLISFMRYATSNQSSVSNQEYSDLLQYGIDNDIYTPEEIDLLQNVSKDNFNQTVNPRSEYTFGFVPGNYTIDSTLMYEPGIYLPAETLDPKTGILDVFIDDEQDMEERSFSSWVSGGAKVNLSLKESDVYRDTPIVLYVLETPIPTSWTELINQPNTQSLLPVYEEYLQPLLN